MIRRNKVWGNKVKDCSRRLHWSLLMYLNDVLKRREITTMNHYSSLSLSLVRRSRANRCNVDFLLPLMRLVIVQVSFVHDLDVLLFLSLFFSLFLSLLSCWCYFLKLITQERFADDLFSLERSLEECVSVSISLPFDALHGCSFSLGVQFGPVGIRNQRKGASFNATESCALIDLIDRAILDRIKSSSKQEVYNS